jgi:hypothetical protein
VFLFRLFTRIEKCCSSNITFICVIMKFFFRSVIYYWLMSFVISNRTKLFNPGLISPVFVR